MFKKTIIIVILLTLGFLFASCTSGEKNLTEEQKKTSELTEELVNLEMKNISNEDMPASLKDETALVSSTVVKPILDVNFNEEDGVRGDAYQRLMDIINEQTLINEARLKYEEATKVVEENKEELISGQILNIGEDTKIYFEANGDSALIEVENKLLDPNTNTNVNLHTKVEKNLIDNKGYYKITVILDKSVGENEDTKISIVEFDEELTIRKEQVKYINTKNNVNRIKILNMQQENGVMKLVARRKGQNRNYELSAYASDDFGAVFSSMEITNSNSEMINGKTFAKEFYNGDGELVKQEFGTAQLDKIIRFMPAPQIIEVVATNIYDYLPNENVDEFTVDFKIGGLPTLEYNGQAFELPTGVNMVKNFAFYNMKGDEWAVGDKIYTISSRELGLDSRILTFKAVFEVPEIKEALNGESYYFTDRYMAKYIEATEGYELQTDGHKYYLTNTEDLTDTTQYVIPIVKSTRNEFFKGYNTPANNVSLVQLNKSLTGDAKIIFTEVEVVDKAENEVNAIYTEMLPSDKEIEEIFNKALESKFTV